jgi:hypothetical protein
MLVAVTRVEPRRVRVVSAMMSSEEPHDESASDNAPPGPHDDAAASEDAEDRPDVRPVKEKIGEGGTNLRDREAALGRRRGREERSP